MTFGGCVTLSKSKPFSGLRFFSSVKSGTCLPGMLRVRGVMARTTWASAMGAIVRPEPPVPIIRTLIALGQPDAVYRSQACPNWSRVPPSHWYSVPPCPTTEQPVSFWFTIDAYPHPDPELGDQALIL